MMMQANTILVAGGTRGIGRGLAELLCRLGNEVLVFDAEPGVAQAVARSVPGMRAVDLDLADPWSVAGFSEQVTATCPGLNMLIHIAIAFPVRSLPGMEALLEDDGSFERLEAQRLGMQHLTGALLPHFRKRSHSAVLNVSAGPMPASAKPALDGGMPGCSLSVRKRWVRACIDVLDVAQPSGAQRMNPAPASRPPGVARAEFISSVAHLLAEGLQEAAALARLRALWPAATAASPRQTRDDDLLAEVH